MSFDVRGGDPAVEQPVTGKIVGNRGAIQMILKCDGAAIASDDGAVHTGAIRFGARSRSYRFSRCMRRPADEIWPIDDGLTHAGCSRAVGCPGRRL